MPSPNWPRERSISDELDGMGRVVVHSLEYTIVYQCVNRCRGCNHFTYIQPEHSVSADQFADDIGAVAEIAHCDKFSLIGGECLLHPRILDLLDIVNEVKIGDVVSLTTNGQLIDRFDGRLWSKLQRIEFGLYAGKGWSVEKLTWLMDMVDRWELPSFFGLVGPHPSSVVDYVRTRVEKHADWKWVLNSGFHPTLTRQAADEEEAQRRFARCLYGHVCLTLDRGYLYRCPESSFVPELLLKKDRRLDGISIDSLDVNEFYRFACREDHLNSCHRCRSLEAYFPWSEEPEGLSAEEWLDSACGDC